MNKAVSLMNGEVDVESSPGVGSVFRVRLPLACREEPYLAASPGEMARQPAAAGEQG